MHWQYQKVYEVYVTNMHKLKNSTEFLLKYLSHPDSVGPYITAYIF